MKNRIIAVNSNCYHGYSIEDAIAGIQAAGFKYIELTATKGWTEHVFPDQSFERLLEVKDLLDEAGLIPFAMSGHTNLMDTERIPDFVKNIRLAHFFGAKYIVSSIFTSRILSCILRNWLSAVFWPILWIICLPRFRVSAM